ncbi:MAG: aldehyde dehydrogenase family protein [Armatimonadetes bacterium]|nr:aldehyde dehydrogenase family protein [Armatimonadota bacterium]
MPGVQVLQALAAGNAVLVKPAPGCTEPMCVLGEALMTSGVPVDVLHVLPETHEAAAEAIRMGVDKVALTGSTSTGSAVLAALAPTATPAVMELGGCDPVFVLDDAREEMAARALRFGLTLNGGRTCVAPRRVYARPPMAGRIACAVGGLVASEPPVPLTPHTASRATDLIADATGRGATIMAGGAPVGGAMRPTVLLGVPRDAPILAEDLFAPWLAFVEVASDADALAASGLCPYALGASVFGVPEQARQFALQVRAGVVTVNDLIAPTAHPGAPFGGAGRSGFGVTRGAEGLLEWTRPRTTVVNRGLRRRHFEPTRVGDEELFLAFLRAAHGSSWKLRFSGLRDVVGALRRRR